MYLVHNCVFIMNPKIASADRGIGQGEVCTPWREKRSHDAQKMCARIKWGAGQGEGDSTWGLEKSFLERKFWGHITNSKKLAVSNRDNNIHDTVWLHIETSPKVCSEKHISHLSQWHFVPWTHWHRGLPLGSRVYREATLRPLTTGNCVPCPLLRFGWRTPANSQNPFCASNLCGTFTYLWTFTNPLRSLKKSDPRPEELHSTQSSSLVFWFSSFLAEKLTDNFYAVLLNLLNQAHNFSLLDQTTVAVSSRPQ